MKGKLKRLTLVAVAVCAVTADAAPSDAERKAAKSIVQMRLGRQRRLYASGALTREQVGDAAMREAASAKGDVERAQMLAGAMLFYSKARADGKAVEAFNRWRTVLPFARSRDVESVFAYVADGLSEESRAALKDSLSTVWWCRSVSRQGYWNVELTDFRMKLLAHEEKGRLCVQPLSQKAGFVDLGKRIVAEDGSALTVDALGDHLESYKRLPHVRWKWDDDMPKGALTGVKLPTTLKRIYASAFENCTNLTEISLPEGVLSTCRRSFFGCSGLREVRLPSHMGQICDEAFRGCTSLQSVEFPASVTNILHHAFADCRSLERVRFLGQETSAKEDAFSGSPCDKDIVRKPKNKQPEVSSDMCPEI